jgi:hypothetical protein
MGGLERKPGSGGGTGGQVDTGVQGTVGKSTQVQDAGAATAGGSTVATPTPMGVRPPTPPEFAAMDPQLVDKLWSSRTTLATEKDAFKGKTDDQFWDAMRLVGAADLHTLNVVTSGAKSVGVWPHIQTIRGWYTYASSYAIEFLGDPLGITTNGQWGKDSPQFMVRREHMNTAHDWYRNNSGPGNPGMHLGVDVGAGYHNIHWDPTNPMDHVGDGSMHVKAMPMPGPIPVVPQLDYEVKGQAIYSTKALVEHAAEIGFFGDRVHNAFKKPESPTEKFLEISGGKDSADKANEFALMEEKAPDKQDGARSAAVVADVRKASAAILKIHQDSQKLALLDDTAAATQLDATIKQLHDAEAALWTALAALIVYLKDESGFRGDYPFDTDAKWAHVATWTAYDAIVTLQKRRKKK